MTLFVVPVISCAAPRLTRRHVCPLSCSHHLSSFLSLSFHQKFYTLSTVAARVFNITVFSTSFLISLKLQKYTSRYYTYLLRSWWWKKWSLSQYCSSRWRGASYSRSGHAVLSATNIPATCQAFNSKFFTSSVSVRWKKKKNISENFLKQHVFLWLSWWKHMDWIIENHKHHG